MIVVRALDIAAALRDVPGSVTVISGFQSPVERECLMFLLKGTVQLVVCPARSASGMRTLAAWKPAIACGRMTIRSPFDEEWIDPLDNSGDTERGHHRHSVAARPRRATVATAEIRNRFVAALSDAVLIVHASPSGKLERLAHGLLSAGEKPVWTLDDPSNAALIVKGARPLQAEMIHQLIEVAHRSKA